ncbi:MAG TPA: ribosome maturation factor RimM [Bordetella sp.]
MSLVPADLIELGRILGAYGIKGWVKVQPHSAQAEVLRSVKQWWLVRPAPQLQGGGQTAAQQPIAYPVVQARPQGATVVAQLQGIADRDQAEAARGCVIMASRSAFPAPAEGEYYWIDLIGCAFYTTATDAPDAQLLGQVVEVLDNGAHAILRVQRQQAGPGGELQPMLDAKERPLELLVPFVAAHIQAVDLAGRRIDSDWPADY